MRHPRTPDRSPATIEAVEKPRRTRRILGWGLLAFALLLSVAVFASTRDPKRQAFERVARDHGLQSIDPAALSGSDFDRAQVAYTSDGLTKDEIEDLLQAVVRLTGSFPKGNSNTSRAPFMHSVTFEYSSGHRGDRIAMGLHATTNIAGGTHVVLTYSHLQSGLIERASDWWSDLKP